MRKQDEMKTPDYVGAVLVVTLSAVSFMFGYAMRIYETSLRNVTAEQLLVTPAVHDAAYNQDNFGVLALGVVRSAGADYSDGDMAVLQIDRATGRVMAKCEVTP